MRGDRWTYTYSEDGTGKTDNPIHVVFYSFFSDFMTQIYVNINKNLQSNTNLNYLSLEYAYDVRVAITADEDLKSNIMTMLYTLFKGTSGLHEKMITCFELN